MMFAHCFSSGLAILLITSPLVANAQTAYITYHNYYEGQSTGTISCSDGANGLQQQFGYYTIDPMFPYVSATSNIVWNSPNCGNCYELQAGGNTVYVTAIDQCGAGPAGELHFDMAQLAFVELLGDAGIAAGSGYATYRAVDGSNCVGNSGSGGPAPVTPAPVTPAPVTPAPVTGSPVPAPPTGGGGSSGGSDGDSEGNGDSSSPNPPNCLSGHDIVTVQGKGPTRMQDLSIGDMVANGKGRFEPVYAFAHLDLNTSTEFLAIHTTPILSDQVSNGAPPLEVTGEHLLLKVSNDGGYQYVPAQSVHVGDMLSGTGTGDERIRVTKIGSVHREGLFAPLTASGTLAVNGVAISCYVSLQGGDSGSFKLASGTKTGLSQHSVAHMLLSPIRLLCMGLPEACGDENLSSGYPWFVRIGFLLIDWMDRHSIFIQVPLFAFGVTICAMSLLLEIVLLSKWGWVGLSLFYLGSMRLSKST
ncbi:Desert hedgehog protein [Seminavis robusta]|uniref:Desert hedgehog protein n=1 Tax=Seminavis robusta TaxID=568900 RepID=A0A9N8EQN0_9STRA|nr:Desert hedgehog protein [Seminavis robusta]|eukprot:Sro1406_g269960.1 Desert hedgehog protein (474) ;mRNA; f:27951-29372